MDFSYAHENILFIAHSHLTCKYNIPMNMIISSSAFKPFSGLPEPLKYLGRGGFPSGLIGWIPLFPPNAVTVHAICMVMCFSSAGEGIWVVGTSKSRMCDTSWGSYCVGSLDWMRNGLWKAWISIWSIYTI